MREFCKGCPIITKKNINIYIYNAKNFFENPTR